MSFTFVHFQIFIHLLVAFVFFIELLEAHLPIQIYTFIKTNKDIIFGCYYLYLAYNIYQTNIPKLLE